MIDLVKRATLALERIALALEALRERVDQAVIEPHPQPAAPRERTSITD